MTIDADPELLPCDASDAAVFARGVFEGLRDKRNASGQEVPLMAFTLFGKIEQAVDGGRVIGFVADSIPLYAAPSKEDAIAALRRTVERIGVRHVVIAHEAWTIRNPTAAQWSMRMAGMTNEEIPGHTEELLVVLEGDNTVRWWHAEIKDGKVGEWTETQATEAHGRMVNMTGLAGAVGR